MVSPNFILGKGERLTADIVIKSSGGTKKHPYSISEARDRLVPLISNTVQKIDTLPKEACPNDEAVISITLHPEFTSKSYFPDKLFRTIGINVIGSRPRKVKPEKRSSKKVAVEMVTTELFAKGSRSSIRKWGERLSTLDTKNQSNLVLSSIEGVSAPVPQNKIKGQLPSKGPLALETVLHASELDLEMLQAFDYFLEKQEINAQFGQRFFAKGLCFQELSVPVDRVKDIAVFTGVRIIRQMPELRVPQSAVNQTIYPLPNVKLPEELPVSSEVRVAVFDGGIPENHPLTKWIKPFVFDNMGNTNAMFLRHGIEVSSAVLFGHIDPTKPLARPYSYIDHYRVLDSTPPKDTHQLYEILNRILFVLENNDYDFINLCIGPELPIEDNDVHAWTAVLDDYLAKNSTLAFIAVGNGGERDTILKYDRIQIPSDCVNALAIGSCDTPYMGWKRASYSSRGPGRSPGKVKPDLVDFGGIITRPFVVLGPDEKPTLSTNWGTSLATPNAMRLGIGVRSHFGANLNHLAIRALLVHTSESNDQDYTEVGWGRVARTLNNVILCEDNAVRIVYQGKISPKKYIRAQIPIIAEPIQGKVSITATICFKSSTDPHHPDNYTRAGLEVIFRPHDERFSKDKQIHPNSASFFSSKLLGANEGHMRNDFGKWENCLHATSRKMGSSLKNPCFDIHYISRLEGRDFTPQEKLEYAMVVTVQAKGVSDLYNRVTSQYSTILEPLQPVLEFPIRTLSGKTKH